MLGRLALTRVNIRSTDDDDDVDVLRSMVWAAMWLPCTLKSHHRFLLGQPSMHATRTLSAGQAWAKNGWSRIILKGQPTQEHLQLGYYYVLLCMYSV